MKDRLYGFLKWRQLHSAGRGYTLFRPKCKHVLCELLVTYFRVRLWTDATDDVLKKSQSEELAAFTVMPGHTALHSKREQHSRAEKQTLSAVYTLVKRRYGGDNPEGKEP